MSILDKFIGKIRAPWYAQITIDTRTGNLKLSYNAQNEDGRKTEASREYTGPLVTGQAITDLLSWLRHSAKEFFGSESGGL